MKQKKMFKKSQQDTLYAGNIITRDISAVTP